MNKNKFYAVVIVALLISNGILVFFMIQKGHREKSFHSPKEIIINRLGFDDAQVESYLELVSIHRETTGNLMKNIQEERSSLYELTPAQTDKERLDSTVVSIGLLQQQLERLNFNHLQDIHSLCNETQLKDFEVLRRDFSEIFKKGKPKHGPKR